MTFKENDSAKLQRLIALEDKGLISSIETNRVHSLDCICGGTCSGSCYVTMALECMCQGGCSGFLTFG